MQRRERRTRWTASCALALIAFGCATAATHREAVVPPPPLQFVVTATAYNSTRAQTDGDPWVTAHGVHLEPGMRIIAVSRDLEDAGLRAGTRVTIEGLPGEWQVADRMPRRRRLAIDVYMGMDVARAREFGRRQVTIRSVSGAE